MLGGIGAQSKTGSWQQQRRNSQPLLGSWENRHDAKDLWTGPSRKLSWFLRFRGVRGGSPTNVFVCVWHRPPSINSLDISLQADNALVCLEAPNTLDDCFVASRYYNLTKRQDNNSKEFCRKGFLTRSNALDISDDIRYMFYSKRLRDGCGCFSRNCR